MLKCNKENSTTKRGNTLLNSNIILAVLHNSTITILKPSIYQLVTESRSAANFIVSSCRGVTRDVAF